MSRYENHKWLWYDDTDAYANKAWNRSFKWALVFFILTVIFFIGPILLISPLLYATDSTSASEANSKRQFLNIDCDKLVVQNNQNTAELSGNVKGSLEDMIVTAQRIRVFFNDQLSGKSKFSMDEASIREIIATENVTIMFNNRIAHADEAVYNSKQKVLVLSGEPVRVTMGEDSVTGTRITFYRKDERIVVEGGEDTRVNAVIYNGNEASEPKE